MPATTIRLEGLLGHEYVRELPAFVNSVAEAIALLECNFPGFRRRLIQLHDLGFAYKVKLNQREIDESELPGPTGRQIITLRPVYAGSGNIGKIVLGVALVALSFTGVGLLGLSSGAMALIGGTLALSGVVGLFNSPKPFDDTAEGDGKPSFVMNGPTNTSAQGNPVPVVLGRGIDGEGVTCGSQVISASYRTKLEVFDADDIED